LTQELHRYCEGQINGRSFLIAGHRGAGKTTMVAAAVMNVQRAAAQSPVPMLRPLFVPLHGPNLFRDEPIARTEPVAGSTERPPADGAPAAGSAGRMTPRDLARDRANPEAQVALIEIALALHRAVCREFGEKFYAAVGRTVYRTDADRAPGLSSWRLNSTWRCTNGRRRCVSASSGSGPAR
jgi:hypothetical protein